MILFVLSFNIFNQDHKKKINLMSQLVFREYKELDNDGVCEKLEDKMDIT
jgi:hypothetical protein